MTPVPQECPRRSIRQLCLLLGVRRAWCSDRSDPPTQPAHATARRDAIARIGLAFPGYGDRRVPAALRRQEGDVNHTRVLRIMRAESLRGQLRRSRLTTTT